ncbi:MAG: helix-turn-helix transcriptional regulator [Alphaproteobacteria bacterium]
MAKTPPRLLRPQKVADILDLTLEGLADWRKRGVGPAWFKLSGGRSGRVRYEEKDLLAWIEAQRSATGWSPDEHG